MVISNQCLPGEDLEMIGHKIRALSWVWGFAAVTAATSWNRMASYLKEIF